MISKLKDGNSMWFIFALLSAVFATSTSILAKIGVEDINSSLATAIHTLVVLFMAWGMVFITETQFQIVDISQKSWVFLILSGIATGLSWLCDYKALQIGLNCILALKTLMAVLRRLSVLFYTTFREKRSVTTDW